MPITQEYLIKKHILPIICDITLKLFEDYFDEIIKESKESAPINETHIGYTFRKLEKMAYKIVKEEIDIMIENTWIKEGSKNRNSFKDLMYGLMAEFFYHFDARPYIEEILGGEWHAKHKELMQSGILDENGDFVQKDTYLRITK